MRLVNRPPHALVWIAAAFSLSISHAGGQKSELLELVMNVGHGGPIRQLVFTPDNLELLSVAADGTLRIWDATRGTLLRAIAAHSEVATTTAVSADGALVATGGDDKMARIWSIQTGALIHEESFDARVSQVFWAAQSRRLAVASGLQIRVVQEVDGRWNERTLTLTRSVDAVTIAGSRLVAAVGQELVVYDDSDLSREPRTMALPGTCKRLVSRGSVVGALLRSGVKLFDVGEIILELGTPAGPAEFEDLDLGDAWLSVVSSKRVEVWNRASGASVKSAAVEGGVVSAVALNRAGSIVALGTLKGDIRLVPIQGDGRERLLPASSLSIGDVTLDAESLRVVTLDDAGLAASALTPDETTVRFRGALLKPRVARWLPAKDHIVADAPLEISSWRISRARRTARFGTTIDAWPLACAPYGLCAWEETDGSTHAVVVRDATMANAPVRRFSIGEDEVLALAIDSSGQRVAVAVNRPAIRQWSLRTGRELAPLSLEIRSEGLLGIDISRSWTPVSRFVVPRAGMATAVDYSADGRFLAAANDAGVHVWATAADRPQAVVLHGFGRVFWLAWAGHRLFSAGQNRELRTWQVGDSNDGHMLARLARVPAGLSVRPDGKFVAISFPDAQLEIWNGAGERLAMIGFPATGEWIAAAADGEFEASENAWRAASWRFGGMTRAVEPVEKYFRDFYYPGLLQEILAGTYRLKSAGVLETLEREPPRVDLQLLQLTPESMALTPDGMVRQPGRIQVRATATPGTTGGRITGLAFTQNEIVVRKWADARSEERPVSEEVTLPLLPGQNRVTTYAFNQDGIRSTEAVWERPMQGSGYLIRPMALRVLIIAVGTYRNPRLNLTYPANDAALVHAALRQSEKQWPGMSRDLTAPARSVDRSALFQTSLRSVPAKLEIATLLDTEATRDRILAALTDLAARTRPEDGVIIYYSGHGGVADDRFYLIPHDAAIQGSAAMLTNDGIRRAASSLVSDIEVERALLPLHATEGAIIIDACRAGAAFAGADFRGPLKIAGLGRLGYEKGLHLLAGAQGTEPAFELRGLGHGALTYALFQAGLLERKGDVQPVDGLVELGEWLRFGASTVRTLTDKSVRGTLQTPRLIPRRVASSSSLLLATTK